MKKIISLTFVAALAMAFVGCDSMKETNSNKAVVVNNNANVSMMNSNMMNSNAMMNSNTMSSSNSAMNPNMSRADYDRDKERYEREAKASGRTIGTGANDTWLWTKTKTALATTAGLRDSTINVDVDNGVITLTGTVGTKEEQQMAVKTANEIEGKTSVKNNLKVQPSDSLTNQMTGGNSTTTNANRRP
ncbi:MAG TPA: BON domain-containing protein [Pyrinomonadaceae bacterium]|nr:BON domain-containing protein [Pyrinomonadaceae bacterium]